MDNRTILYENDIIKLKYQELIAINMVNMIIYDDNGKPMMFDDEPSEDFELDSYLEPKKKKKRHAMLQNEVRKVFLILFYTKEYLIYILFKIRKKKDKCKKNIIQNFKNTNAKISLLELFETSNEHRMALFEFLSGIGVDTIISISAFI